MKPFDLEKALAGEPVVTRDGREATQLTLFKLVNDSLPLVGNVGCDLCQWTKEGRYYAGDAESGYDLFMKPKTVVKWVNLYSTGEEEVDAYLHDSEFEADKAGNEGWKRLGNKAHRIEWEE